MDSISPKDYDAIVGHLLRNNPDLRSDIKQMEAQFRELVKVERQKMGLDRPGGQLWLYPNQERKNDNDPDLIGKGQVNGRAYQAVGWLGQNQKLKIALLPLKP